MQWPVRVVVQALKVMAKGATMFTIDFGAENGTFRYPLHKGVNMLHAPCSLFAYPSSGCLHDERPNIRST